MMSNTALYVVYSLGLTHQFPYVVFTVLTTSILWIAAWQMVVVKFGKKTALFAGLIFSLPFVLSLLYLSYFPLGIYPVGIAIGFGVSCAYLVPW